MRVVGSVLHLPFDDIDTDQIIPAEYLTGVDERGLGAHLFEGDAGLARRLADAQGASIVVAGKNFGCGSSREHAVWALRQRGFSAVIAQSFSRIFIENAYNNGLVPVALDAEGIRACASSDRFAVDVDAERVELGDGTTLAFALDPLRKLFLLEGGYLRFIAAKREMAKEWLACRI